MDWSRPWQAGREILIAAVLAAGLEAELGFSDRLSSAARAAAALLATVPLVLRLRLPVTAMALVVSGVVVEAALGIRFPDQIFALIAVLVALHAVGSRASGAQFIAGAGVALAGMMTAGILSNGNRPGDLIAAPIVVACGLIIGRALGVLQFETDTLARRASELERERDERARIAVAEERRRIARELHDVIGHSISVMGVQAGAVRSVLRDDQHREREALIAVERTGRQAVSEMHRLLDLLRTDEDGAGTATPSLCRIEELVGEMRDAGLAVRMTVDGDLTTLPPGVDLAGFRIVQEALTNALKHAPGSHVDARVVCTDRALEIDVTDDGGPAPVTSSNHAGHGLLGMRERISLYGGKLVTGTRAAGGFEVRARIPLEPS